MNGHIEFEKIVLWIVIIVRVSVLVAIVWFGVNEYKRWKKKQPNDEKDNDSNPTIQ